jgi:hypothetical protein
MEIDSGNNLHTHNEKLDNEKIANKFKDLNLIVTDLISSLNDDSDQSLKSMFI